MSRAIVTGGTTTDVAAIGTLAINLKETNSRLFDKFVVFHDGFSTKDMKIISSIWDAEFIKYKYPNKSRNDVVVNYFSPMVFCKYELFELLTRFDEVVWTDYDVVIKKSLDVFCENDSKDVHLLDVGNARHMFFENVNSENVKEFDLFGKGMHTSLFWMSNSINCPQKIKQWCYEMTKKCDKDIYLPEQCIFSLALQKFNLSYTDYSFREYACVPEKMVGDEYIIHAAGYPKFWNGRENDDWNQMYLKWIELGGSKYSEKKKKIKTIFRLLFSRLRGVTK